MTQVKICGMRRPEDIRHANRLRPEMIGFVFWKPSKRYVSPDEAAKLRSILDNGITPVGVFVDEDPKVVADIATNGTIDMIQLHGAEDEEYIHGLRKLTDAPIIRTFCVRSEEDLVKASGSSADMVLLDNGKGTGQTFDWTLMKDLGRDFILSGGLSESNVGDAVRRFHPFAVDVSSAMETDGFKDRSKMERFIDAVRSA
ncbi:MAG: phosphoribosylanthranilate isomerase [Candidatus Methanomethylophilaceae archaeon]|nr:phosphoribosylanthranilate isomerase [Candidatus Methanomethylophilaceae archaeon]